MASERPPLNASDKTGIDAALDEARKAVPAGEVPVGAAIVVNGDVVARSHNSTVSENDLTRHAEVIVIRNAMEILGKDRLENATLCVTLEPCAQCAGAIVLSRVGRVVFGAYDHKAGMAGSVEDLLRHRSLNHKPEVVGGVEAEACGALLKGFFEQRR